MFDWIPVVGVLLGIWCGAEAVKKQEIKVLKELMLSFVVEAEKIYGAGTGEVKYSLVLDWVYQSIPSFMKPLFTAEDLEYLIEEGVMLGNYLWERERALQDYLENYFYDELG